MAGDVLTLEDDDRQEGEALLRPVMRDGRRLPALATLVEARTHAARELARLPRHLAALEDGPAYAVTVAPALRALADEVDRAMARDEQG